MRKTGGTEKKRVRRQSSAVQNGAKDPNSDTPPRFWGSYVGHLDKMASWAQEAEVAARSNFERSVAQGDVLKISDPMSFLHHALNDLNQARLSLYEGITHIDHELTEHSRLRTEADEKAAEAMRGEAVAKGMAEHLCQDLGASNSRAEVLKAEVARLRAELEKMAGSCQAEADRTAQLQAELDEARAKLLDPKFLRWSFEQLQEYKDFEKSLMWDGLTFGLNQASLQFPPLDHTQVLAEYERQWRPLTVEEVAELEDELCRMNQAEEDPRRADTGNASRAP